LGLASGDELDEVDTDTAGRHVLDTVVSSEGRRVDFWDLSAGQVVSTLHVPSNETGAGEGVLSPDGTEAALDTGHGTITLYRVPGFSPISTFSVRLSGPNAGRVIVVPEAFSPDGNLLVSGLDPGPAVGGAHPITGGPADQLLALVDPGTGSVLGQLGMGQEATLTAVDWSPSGDRLVAGTTGGEVWLLRAGDLRPLVPAAPAVSGYVLADTFSPGGATIAVTGTDGTLNFFDGHSLRRIGDQIQMPADDWTVAGYDGVGDQVAGLAPTVDGLDRRMTFPGSPDVWARVACSIARSNLTRAEWARSVGDLPYRPQCPQF
jgi:WD40 repeat protein